MNVPASGDAYADRRLAFLNNPNEYASMQRIWAFLIIAAMLVANFEILTDLEEVLPADADTSSLISSLDGGAPINPDGESDCDHCCHASAHFAGVISELADPQMITASRDLIRAIPGLHSVVYSPHLRPPIV